MVTILGLFTVNPRKIPSDPKLCIMNYALKKGVPTLNGLTLPLLLKIKFRELAQLCEVLNGANHLRGVRVLVVVPRNNLNLIGIFVELHDHSLCSVEK